jgi:hypothetical protein
MKEKVAWIFVIGFLIVTLAIGAYQLTGNASQSEIRNSQRACYDSDGGQYEDIFGLVTTTTSRGVETDYPDACEGNSVKEGWCTLTGTYKVERIRCSFGTTCLNGYCQ